ncbi:MAG: exodeoxyribonuclease VII small subunit [Eubacterium sp.]|nr:exodeoxyribonuclease VII small subunit [Eubacterium sp.]
MAESKKKNEEFNIETALARLEEINGELTKSGTTLKDSMALYKEGVELAEKCKENLEGVEKEIQILNEND